MKNVDHFLKFIHIFYKSPNHISDLKTGLNSYFEDVLKEETKANVLIIGEKKIWHTIAGRELDSFFNLHYAFDGMSVISELMEDIEYDTIVLDINLKGASVNELWSKIKKFYEDAKIIIATSYEEVPLIIDIFRKGAFDFINKPIEITEFTQALGNAWMAKRLPTFSISLYKQTISERLFTFNSYVQFLKLKNLSLSKTDIFIFFPEIFIGGYEQTSITNTEMFKLKENKIQKSPEQIHRHSIEKGKKLTLVIEPKDEIATLLKSRNDFQIISFKVFDEANQFYLKNHFQIDYVLFDTGVCKDDWKVRIDEMIKNSIIPKIILIDEGEEIKDAINAAKLGVNGYVKKSSLESTLLIKIEEIDNNNLKTTSNKLKQANYWVNQFGIPNEEKINRILWLLENFSKRKYVQERGNPINDFLNESSGDLSITELETLLKKHVQKEKLILKKSKLLHIEDEYYFRKILSKNLEKDFEILEASNYENAIDQVQTNNDISIILLDIRLPRISGPQMYPEIKEYLPEAETIVLTAYEERDIAVNMIKQGAFDFINKTADREVMMSTIYQAWIKHSVSEIDSKIDISKLSLFKRLFFLNYLLSVRSKNNADIYFIDFNSIFPELRVKIQNIA